MSDNIQIDITTIQDNINIDYSYPAGPQGPQGPAGIPDTTVINSVSSLLTPLTVYQSASGNWQSTFTNVQSNSANWNTAYSAITGTTQLYTYYVSPSGNNSNPGTEALPLSTVNRAVQLAGNNDLRVILTSGTFVNQQIDLSNLRSLEVIGDQNGRTIIRNGTTYSSWTLHSGSVYKTTATPEATAVGMPVLSTLNFYQLDTAVNAIPAIDSLPPQHGRSYRLQHAPITRSSSLNDILTGANGRWWYESNEFYFKTYDGTAATGKSLHVSHPSLSGSFIYNGNGSISKVTVSNIEIVGANIGIDLSYVRQADITRAIVFGTTVYGVYGMNSGAVNIRNCEFAYTGDDSINFKGDQNNIPIANFQNRDINVYDCWVHDSIDKGLVAHERTTINVYGGLVEYNSQTGIMAFTGGEIYMNGVTTRGHTTTQGVEIAGTILASEGGIGTFIQALNCVSLQDRIGYRVNPYSVTSKTKLDLINCTIDAPTLAGIYTSGVGTSVLSTTDHKLNAIGINLTSSGQLITATSTASATVNIQNATITRSSSPEGNVTAPVGTIARVTSGGLNTTLYVKVSGNINDNTGWRGLVTQ